MILRFPSHIEGEDSMGKEKIKNKIKNKFKNKINSIDIDLILTLNLNP